MSVERGHSDVPKTRQPNVVGGLTAAGRFAAIAAFLVANGEGHAPIVNASRPNAEQSVQHETGSLMENEIVVVSRAGKKFVVSVERSESDLSLIVNGKRYTVRDDLQIPGLRPGDAIDDIVIGPESLEIHSSQYGSASVCTSETERVFAELSQTDTRAILLSIAAKVHPKKGTIAALYLSLNTPKTYDIVFERANADVGLFAMVDEH